MFDDLTSLARLFGWLVVLGLAVLFAGFVVEQARRQVGTIARIPG